MAKNKAIIEKGAYIHYQAGSFIKVKHFIVVNESDRKCLLLKLMNNSETMVKEIKFTLIQMNALGKVIAKDDFTFSKLKIAPSAEYALESGLVLKDACVDFRIQIVYALSGGYKYVFKNGQTLQSYDPRGYKTVKTAGEDGDVQVVRRYEKSRKIHALISFIGVAAVLLVSAYAVMTVLL